MNLHDDVLLAQESDERRRGDTEFSRQRPGTLTGPRPSHNLIDFVLPEALRQLMRLIRNGLTQTIDMITRNREFPQETRCQTIFYSV